MKRSASDGNRNQYHETQSTRTCKQKLQVLDKKGSLTSFLGVRVNGARVLDVVLDEVIRALDERGRHVARHDVDIFVLRVPHRDVTIGVDNVLIVQYVIRRDEFTSQLEMCYLMVNCTARPHSVEAPRGWMEMMPHTSATSCFAQSARAVDLGSEYQSMISFSTCFLAAQSGDLRLL